MNWSEFALEDSDRVRMERKQETERPRWNLGLSGRGLFRFTSTVCDAAI